MLPRSLSTKVFIRDGWRCRNPACLSRNNLHPHHVKFKSQGGEDSLENLLTLCFQCHERVHKKELDIIVLDVVHSNLVVKFWSK